MCKAAHGWVMYGFQGGRHWQILPPGFALLYVYICVFVALEIMLKPIFHYYEAAAWL